MNTEHVTMLLESVEKWNIWRLSDSTSPNLSRAYLSGANLRGANLTEAYLSGADLSRANLSRANLSGANLRGADLSGANLTYADLSGANLTYADLSGADLSGANLSGANLRDANLSMANGLLDPVEYIAQNFEPSQDGIIVYKTFSGQYAPPETWKVEPGSVITEICNPDRGTDCASGVNVATLAWVKKTYPNLPIWKLLIRWEWLPGVVVPFMTDGKIRCSRAQLLEVVS